MMYNMMKSGKGCVFLTSIVRSCIPSRLFCTNPDFGYDFMEWDSRPLPEELAVDVLGRPFPCERVLSVIESIERLPKKEKFEYRFIFSEALGLPTPPKTPKGADERFLVKLVKFDRPNLIPVLRELADARATEDKTSLSQFYLGDCYRIVNNVPSIVKKYVTKEEAEDIVAKLNAAGGLAVVEEVVEKEE